jgi:hypothetical protein
MNPLAMTSCCLVCAACAGAPPSLAAEQSAGLPQRSLGLIVHESHGQVTRIGGIPLATGDSAQQSAEIFRHKYAAFLGAAEADLHLAPLAPDEPTLQPLMYDPPTGANRFILLRYLQERNGIAVFRGDLRVMCVNEPGYPLVWACSSLRQLGNFEPDPALLARPLDPATALGESFEAYSPAEPVIWAGLQGADEPPVLALTFVAENTYPDRAKWLYVVDALTGRVLFRENHVVAAISGTVSGMATLGPRTGECTRPHLQPLPWATVAQYAGASVYADASGCFTYPSDTPVSLISPIAGRFFYVDDTTGAEEYLIESAIPPGPVAFVHNEADASERLRAQVDAYVHANIVHDACLRYCPEYPIIGGPTPQEHFSIRVNSIETTGCPSFYDEAAINFCQAGSWGVPPHPYANGTFSIAVYHEYTHHMIHCASGGDPGGQYGEGMADSVAMLISDVPDSGYGLRTDLPHDDDCESYTRSAENPVVPPGTPR